jgi:ribose/xylose/arabinose/galactoside ABC-type transport system permease subunit
MLMSDALKTRPSMPLNETLGKDSPLQILRTTVRGSVADYGIVILFIGLLILGRAVYAGFFTSANLKSIVSQSAPLGIVAIGMTFVIIAGGFDLSVGAIFAIGATIFAAMGNTHSWIESGVVAVLAGLGLGLINAVVVTLLRVNPFIATLGTSSIYGGGVLLLTNNNAYTLTRFSALGSDNVLTIPISILVLVFLFAVGWVVLRMTVYGRGVYAVGGNDEAARLAGLRVALIRGSTYVLSGGLAAFAGIMQASRLSSGQGNIGGTVALNAIAVVVIGGTALLGGEGAIWRTGVGLLIIGILSNVFFSLALSGNWQTIVTGVILILAVAFDVAIRTGRRT